MVSGSAALRQRAARGLWDGHRALHRVDVRHRAYSRDDSISANALSFASLTQLSETPNSYEHSNKTYDADGRSPPGHGLSGRDSSAEGFARLGPEVHAGTGE